MLKRFAGSTAVVTLLSMVILISCSSDKKSTNGGNSKEPPALTTPQSPPTVTINSDDPGAMAAQALARGTIGAVNALLGPAEGFLTPLAEAEWGDPVAGCWTLLLDLEGDCAWTFEVCEVEGGYSWELRFDGNCEGIEYDDWVAFSGTSDEEGLTGEIVYYLTNTADVLGAFTWNNAQNGLSGGVDWYQGEIIEENRSASFDWVWNGDDSMELTWETFGESPSKWEAHLGADGTDGTLTIYLWTGTEYYKSSELIWNADGSGSFTTYDENGNIIEEDSWTGQATGKKPPTLVTPEIQTNVDFNSNDQTVLGYQAIVEGTFLLATTYLNYENAFVALLLNVEWGDQVGGCWGYSYGGVCGYSYEICEDGDQLTWLLTNDGDCGGIVYNDWIAYSGSTDIEGYAGEFRHFTTNTTDVLYAWAWEIAEDLKSGGWDFYDGEILEENVVSRIDWMENIDASQDVVYEIPGDFPTKMTAHTSSTGTSGNWSQHLWTGTEYYKSIEIVWNADGTGSYTEFDESGTILTQDPW